MAFASRTALKNAFTKGLRPKQQDFWDWIEAFYHKDEDQIKMGGWQFRSLFKDLRAEGITNLGLGGVTTVEIPVGVKILRKVRVTGRVTSAAPPYTVTTDLSYFSDKNIAALNGVASIGSPFPTSMFGHFLLGVNSNPVTNFVISANTIEFAQTLDLTSKNITLDFNEVRFLRINIKVPAGTTLSYAYYGFLYE